MKILHTADWHIGQFKGPVVDGVNLRSQDTVNCLNYMIKVAEEEKPDIVCVSGDVFHQEQIGPVRYSDEMIVATDTITKLAGVAKAVIVMRGTPNHDGGGQFRVLSKMFANTGNVHIVTSPTVLRTPYADIACIPGFDKQEFRSRFPGLSADEENEAWTSYISSMVMGLRAECHNTSILMAHYTVPGCNMESGQTSFFTNFEPVIPREALEAAGYEAVLLGHIHRPQQINGLHNVYYSGAINAMNFNDEHQNRGFYIHEFMGGEMTSSQFCGTPYRRFKTIDWDTNQVSPYIIHPDQELTISMDTIKAEMDGDKAQAAIEQAMSALDAEGAEMSVTAEGVKVDLANVEVDSDVAAAQIESALGMESGTLAANGIEIQAGATVTIPQELVQVDTSGIQSATEAQTETEPVETDTSANVNITEATTDASGAKEQAQSEVESTFSESMPADGHTDVTLDQTNNAAEVYSEVASEVQSTFSNPIAASCTVNVTLDWHITNPSAGITTSGSGSSVTASIAGNAEGSIVTGPLLSWVGEDGPEAIIPLGSKRRDRGMDLWLQAGRALGVKEYADGGMIGDVPLSGGSSDSTSGDSSGSGDKGQVVINMNPVFNINGNSGNDTVNTIKEKLKELINEMSGELATRLLESYANMPT